MDPHPDLKIGHAFSAFDKETSSFSVGGDSGSLVVDADGKFTALLTGGSNINPNDGLVDKTDITYATPMHWLWRIISAKFPGANLYWSNDD